MNNSMHRFLVFGLTFSTFLLIQSSHVFSQQAVFSRGEASTGLWWSGSNPWIRACDNWFLDRPDKNTCGNWPNIGRNDVFIGHNNNNPMTVNGTFFQLRDMTIQGTVSISRTFNSASGGLSFSRGLFNHSTQNQTFNVGIGVDGTIVDFEALNGGLTFTDNFFLNANTARFLGAQSTTVSGTLQGSGGNVLKTGAGTLTITGSANSYTGHTTITSGTLRLNPNANATMSSEIRMNGGILSTQGIVGGRTITNSGMLRLDANSTIDMASVKHDLIFANSSGSSWTGGATLTILNWAGTPGLSGDFGRIFFGSTDSGLNVGQLAQVNINGFIYGAMLLPTGELVAKPNPLPVTLIGLSASCSQQYQVALNWETASEFNASHFIVERSEDGHTWSGIGSVPASGNSITRVAYQFIDHEPVRVLTSYYRLVQYDLDGQFEIFGPVSSICDQDEDKFTVFPNPVEDNVHFAFYSDLAQTDLSVLIYDAQGRLHYSCDYRAILGNNVIIADLSGLQSGMYSVVIKDDKQIVHAATIVKQ